MLSKFNPTRTSVRNGDSIKTLWVGVGVC